MDLSPTADRQHMSKRDVIASEAVGFVPDAAFSNEADDGHSVAESGGRFLLPDADSNQAFSKFVNGKCGHSVCLSFSRCATSLLKVVWDLRVLRNIRR